MKESSITCVDKEYANDNIDWAIVTLNLIIHTYLRGQLEHKSLGRWWQTVSKNCKQHIANHTFLDASEDPIMYVDDPRTIRNVTCMMTTMFG